MSDDPWELEAMAERHMERGDGEVSRNQALFSVRNKLHGFEGKPKLLKRRKSTSDKNPNPTTEKDKML